MIIKLTGKELYLKTGFVVIFSGVFMLLWTEESSVSDFLK